MTLHRLTEAERRNFRSGLWLFRKLRDRGSDLGKMDAAGVARPRNIEERTSGTHEIEERR